MARNITKNHMSPFGLSRAATEAIESIPPITYRRSSNISTQNRPDNRPKSPEPVSTDKVNTKPDYNSMSYNELNSKLSEAARNLGVSRSKLLGARGSKKDDLISALQSIDLET